MPRDATNTDPSFENPYDRADREEREAEIAESLREIPDEPEEEIWENEQ